MIPSQVAIPRLFALALAECRGAWRRFAFFVICLAIGVGAVMTVKSFTLILESSIEREARSLLAADVEVRDSWEMSRKDVEFLRKTLPAGSEFLVVMELKAMARYRGGRTDEPGSFLVELKSVPETPPLYPLYGRLKTAPDEPAFRLLENAGALVEPSFLARTGLRIGDSFALGKAFVRIAGEIVAEPDRISRSFSIGPRVIVSHATLREAGLVQPGSRVTHRTLIRLPGTADLKKTAEMLEQGLSDKTAEVRTYKQMQSSLVASIAQIGQYLGCIGIIALLMGGIGVAMIVSAFMAQKLDTIAILNCIGAAPRTIFKIYLLQSLLLGSVGSFLGIGIGCAAQYLLPPRVGQLLNLAIEPELRWLPAAQSLVLGLLTTLLFAVWPLARAVKTRPLRLFRRLAEEETLNQGSRRERWIVGAGFAAGLALMVFWQAGSFKRAAIFLTALVVSASVLSGVSWLILKLLSKLPAARNMTLHYGIANLYRPNSQAVSIITSLGIGVMLILTIRLVQLDIVSMLRDNRETRPPNYFFVDIQPDQREKFLQTLDSIVPQAQRTLTPLIRSRFYGLDSKTANRGEFKDSRDERWLRREFVLTYIESELPRDNEIVSGKWWDKEGAKQPQASLEEDAANRLGATIGSTIVMDIQGVRVSAPVTSIRRVNWRNMRTNFYIVFTPAALAGAPATLVATVHVPEGKELPLQQAVAQALPNITAITTRDIVQTVESVVAKLITLVDFISAFSIMTGLFILSGAVVSTKFRRLRESAILKTLGARRKTVAAILGCEYAALGAIAAFIGGALSQALSWAVMEYLIEAPWKPHPAHLAATFALAVFLTTFTGILSSLDALNNKPLQTLREIEG